MQEFYGFNIIYLLETVLRGDRFMLPEGLMFRLLDVMNIGITYIDEDGKVLYCNNEASELLNLNQEKMIGNSVLACHPKSKYKDVEDKIIGLQKSSASEWHRIIKRGGRFLENYYSSIFLEGRYKGIVIATKNVTERETLSESLRTSYNEMSVLFEATQLVNSTLNVQQVLDSCKAGSEGGWF